MNRPLRTCLLTLALFSSTHVFAADQSVKEAQAYFTEKNFSAAKSLLEQQLAQPVLTATTKNDCHYWLGRIALETKDNDAALQHFETAVSLLPDTAEEHYWYGMANLQMIEQASLFRKMGFASTGKEQLLLAIEKNPPMLQARQALMQFYLQAPAIGGGSDDKAQQQADAIAKISPEAGVLAQVEINKQTLSEAGRLAYLNGLDLGKSFSAEALFIIGFEYQTLKNYDKAVHCFEQAISKAQSADDDYHHYASLYQIGRTSLFSKHNLKAGITALQQYRQREPLGDLPSLSWAKVRLAALYRLNNQKSLAEEVLHELNRQPADEVQLVNQIRQEEKALAD